MHFIYTRHNPGLRRLPILVSAIYGHPLFMVNLIKWVFIFLLIPTVDPTREHRVTFLINLITSSFLFWFKIQFLDFIAALCHQVCDHNLCQYSFLDLSYGGRVIFVYFIFSHCSFWFIIASLLGIIVLAF